VHALPELRIRLEDIRIYADVEQRNEIEARRELCGQGLYAIGIYHTKIRAGGRRERGRSQPLRQKR
jgi:hypothetical protein